MNEEFLDYWQSPADLPFPDSHSDLKAWCHDAFLAGAAAMKERCAEVAEKMAGWPPETPANCCREDYENHYIAKDIAAAIRGQRND